MQKPEYVLQRADELIKMAIGNGEKEKRLALDHLHGHIQASRNKRQTQWNKVYESLMKRHLELCVELRDDRTAKDGLHQYRFMSQQMDPNSLENVIFYLIEMAEAKALTAREKADTVALAAAAKVQDLDQEESPESIMLSSMTDEGSRGRTDIEVVVPWLKFLWEIYRAVLELLYKNSKLERVYHSAATKAFKFCQDYQRNLEFKRLCGMLRDHLVNLQKPTNKTGKVPTWEWTPEAVEYHLQTRFQQLEVATALELWNEGFKTVEEIYAIILIGKKTPKPKIMSTYYEKLTRIFIVSGNHLFHAYCWYRYYSLSCDHKRDLSPDERCNMASSVLLSALCIPSVKDAGVDPSSAVMATDENDAAYEKNQRMAQLLDFQANPTRHSLLQDIVEKGVLDHVLPELRELYYFMEEKFHPLTLAKSVCPAVETVKRNKSLAVYTVPLQRVAVLRVMLQLSHVFSTVKIDFVKRILAPLSDVSYLDVERIMVEGILRKDLPMKIDHRGKCLRFSAKMIVDAKNTDSESCLTVENQSAVVAVALQRVAQMTTTGTSDALQGFSKAESVVRKEFLMKVLASAEDEHAFLQERKNLIERRKEGLERVQNAKAEADRVKKEEAAVARKKDENERLVLEEAARELDKKRKLSERMEIIRIQKEMERYGVNIEEQELTVMDKDARALTLSDARKEAERSKSDEERRILDQAKRLDHITRALRIEGAKAIGPLYLKAVESDRAAYKAKVASATTAAREKHRLDLEKKNYLDDKQAYREVFESDIVQLQRKKWEAECAKIKERAIKEERQRRLARARQALAEEIERQQEEEEAEREREAQAERDRIEAEQHRKLREQQEAEEERERLREEAREKDRAATVAKGPTFGERRGMGMAVAGDGGLPRGDGFSGGFGVIREDGGGFRTRDIGGMGFGRGEYGGDDNDERGMRGGLREGRPEMQGDSWGRVKRDPPLPPREPSAADEAETWGRTRMQPQLSAAAPDANSWRPGGGGRAQSNQGGGRSLDQAFGSGSGGGGGSDVWRPRVGSGPPPVSSSGGAGGSGRSLNQAFGGGSGGGSFARRGGGDRDRDNSGSGFGASKERRGGDFDKSRGGDANSRWR